MEKLADIVHSDYVTSLEDSEDEVMERSECVSHKIASAAVTAGTSTLTVVMEKAGSVTADENNHHKSPEAGNSLKSPQLEDLDSFNLIEPPPLDWRSDSSSECSLRDIDDPGSFNTDSMDAPLEELSDYGAPNMSCTPTETPSEDLTSQEMGIDDSNGNTLQTNLVEEEKEEEESPKEQVGRQDLDHSHIQTLLTQLQLFHPTPSPNDITQEPEQERPASSPDTLTDRHFSPCLLPEISALPTCPEGNIASGLLFTESHQRDLLEILEEPESKEPQVIYTAHSVDSHIGHMSQLNDHQTRYISQSGEADEMVSVSYGQDMWHSPFEDEFMVSGYSKDEVLEQWQQSKGLSSDKVSSDSGDVNAEAETQPSYKDVPGPCDPEDLLDGVIFGAKYLGSTQLQSDRNPSTNARMAQAQEAVDRIKAPEGESQPMTEVDLFISTQRIKVLSADSQEAMMDHPLQMISYIADIGNIVVLMARRKPAPRKPTDAEASSSSPPKKCWMICHVFSSEDANVIAQAIGQAFGVAYQQFLQENGLKAGELRPGEYSDYLGTQEQYNGDLVHFSRSENIREVCIKKQIGEILGVAVVESGWGSILPTVVVANLLHGGPAERSGELSIGDRIMSVNGTSLVGLPITTCHNIIRDLKNQAQVKISIVHCPPVTMAIIKRPDPKYQLGFSVEDGIICSLMRGGIAERGGIRVGHRIIEINGQSVVATPHEKIIQILSNAVGEIHLKTMPTSTYRLLTGQEQPVFL
ncbi:amyloid-beta A4 precursor protein-binding family A member 1 [Salminus brasiliensis]|uniref:amyloid-beta A4 precursor protein-binding family A member 1 n=1 Tax=Salminus brasiliensis TaxID=930266 RepID=UPI003B82CADE